MTRLNPSDIGRNKMNIRRQMAFYSFEARQQPTGNVHCRDPYGLAGR
jgi:hypothetical protein